MAARHGNVYLKQSLKNGNEYFRVVVTQEGKDFLKQSQGNVFLNIFPDKNKVASASSTQAYGKEAVGYAFFNTPQPNGGGGFQRKGGNEGGQGNFKPQAPVNNANEKLPWE